MTENTKTPSPFPDPNFIHETPNDLTAKSLSTCMAKTMGKDHPAATLEAMSQSLLAVLHHEGDGENRLHRQAQTLDALFHTLIDEALSPDTPTDLTLIAAALRAQKQSQEATARAHLMPYTKAMTEHIADKPSESLADVIIRREKRALNPSAPLFDKQTGLGENES